jgi:hypothetical protein
VAAFQFEIFFCPTYKPLRFELLDRQASKSLNAMLGDFLKIQRTTSRAKKLSGAIGAMAIARLEILPTRD